MNKYFQYPSVRTAISCLFLLASSALIPAQSGLKDAVPSPQSETFRKTDELALPWRITGCGAEHKENNSGCHIVTKKEFDQNDDLSLFNADGSLWYRFSVSYWQPNHFVKQKNPAFAPFATVGLEKGFSAGPILRLVGISKNWYEVEVDEKSQATKFVSQQDISWARVTWDYWWRSDPRTYIDDQTQLFDKPNGSPTDSRGVRYFFFQETSGDWARLEGFDANTSFTAWIIWRKERNILVGNVYNSFVIPKMTR